MSQKDAETRAYHMDPLRRIFIGAVCAPFIPGGLWVAIICWPSKDRLFGIVFASCLALFGAGFFWIIDRARIETSPLGVKLRLLGMTLETSWQNIEGLRMERGREAFVTTSPMEGSGPRRLESTGGRTNYDQTARRLTAERRYLPIGVFSRHLRGGLGEDVRRFAPHLQAALDAGPPPPNLADRKIVWKACALSVLLFAGLWTLLAAAPSWMDQVGKILSIILPLLLAAGFVWPAVQAFRTKKILFGVIYTLGSIFMTLLALGSFGAMVGPARNGANHAKSPSALKKPAL
jgi:hypothetical protein